MENSPLNQIRKRIKVDLYGISQGLGIRPTLFKLARDNNLLGHLQNKDGHLSLSLEGADKDLHSFISSYQDILPPEAQIEKARIEWEKAQGANSLAILKSENSREELPGIPSDLATCSHCWAEFHSPTNRRYNYPFLSCTLCGPRYSAVKSSPYDRVNTTFSSFPQCPDCLKEYHDPQDRRFHAQTTACQICGPSATLCRPNGELTTHSHFADLQNKVSEILEKGEIIAFQSMGGFALVCDASNESAILKLRQRKKRRTKPFALLVKDIKRAKEIIQLTEEHEQLLQSKSCPILIAPYLKNSLATKELINPVDSTLGIILPATPFHLALLGNTKNVVYTSGNLSGDPIETVPSQAIEKLKDVADYFLFQNREIEHAVDDSIIHHSGTQIRLARGLSPRKFQFDSKFKSTSLALGAQMKNTIALGTQDHAILSPHLGNLISFKSCQRFNKEITNFLRFHCATPKRLIIDKHPGYYSHSWAREYSLEHDIDVLEVQHHHAHAAAASFEGQLQESLNLVFDGTGLGDDGLLWGGELLYLKQNFSTYKRLASFLPSQVPGGESSIINPKWQALARLKESGISPTAPIPFSDNVLNSSVGRLFDACSYLIGAHLTEVSFEAEAAIKLQELAKKSDHSFSFETQLKDDLLLIDPRPMIKEIYHSNKDRSLMASRFHATICAMALNMAQYGREKTGCHHITLSGGVFNNTILQEGLLELLKKNQFTVFLPKMHPLGDGGISLGQLVVAKHREAFHA